MRNFAGLVKVEDLKREMRAQYSALRDAGVAVSHVDGHGHNHRLPRSLRALAELRSELGFAKVRRCQDLTAAGGKAGLLSRAMNGCLQKLFDRTGFKSTDHFLMNAGHSSDPNWFSKAIKSLPEGVTEIGVHPGVDEEFRKIDIEDCFANCAALCRKYSIAMINFNDI